MDSFEVLIDNAKAASNSEYAKLLLENIERNAGRDSFLENIFKTLKSGKFEPFSLPEWTGATIVILAVILLVELLKDSFKSNVIYCSLIYILRLLLASVFVLPISDLVLNTCGYMEETVAFLGVLTPTIGVVAASGGNIAAAKTLNVFMTLILSVFQVFLSKILPLVCSVFFGITILDIVNCEGRMLILSQTIRNVCYSAFSLSTALFCIILSTQSLAATGTDTFSAKAIRLAIGNAVPIVGGTLGEALKLVGGSIVTVKNTVGTAAVVFLLLMYLPPLLLLWGNGVLINFYMFLCDYFSLSGVKSLFVHIKYLLGFVLAAITTLFVMGMINIGIFIGIVPAIAV